MLYYNEREYDNFKFSAVVSSDGDIPYGSAVEFTTHIVGQSLPVVKTASADTNDVDDAPRSSYIGVAWSAGTSGQIIQVRPWIMGTMPALCKQTSDIIAGGIWYWNGSEFDTTTTISLHTAINMSKIIGNASSQIAEFLIVKGGRT